MTTFVLFYYLSTFSASSGMATATQEFDSKAACEAAGAAVKRNFGGVYTQVYFFCFERSRP